MGGGPETPRGPSDLRFPAVEVARYNSIDRSVLDKKLRGRQMRRAKPLATGTLSRCRGKCRGRKIAEDRAEEYSTVSQESAKAVAEQVEIAPPETKRQKKPKRQPRYQVIPAARADG